MKIHMVKQGDSLYSIAQKYGVSLEEVVKANPEISNPDAIEVGMKVKIPSRPQTSVEVIHHHVVQQGDTLWKLSKSWGIQLSDMIKANPQLKNPNALLTGEVVNIPKPGHQGNGATTVTMHNNSGKANTGVMPLPGTKANTGVQPVPAPAPTPMPTPAPAPVQVMPVVPVAPTPAPQPAPAPVMPIAETKPIYGIEVHEHVELFKQYPVPAVQATVHKETTHPDALLYNYGQGYGMQQPAYVNPAQTGYGYGMQQPAYTDPDQMAYGYGAQQPAYVDSAQAAYGYSHGQYQPSITPLSGHIDGQISGLGLYGQQDISYSPPDGDSSIPGLQVPIMASGKPTSGCKTCGGQSLWSSAAPATADSAHYPDSYPGMAYADGRAGYGIPPYAAVPYGYAPQAVSPAGIFPGVQSAPYYGASPMGDMPVGGSPITEGLPGVVAGVANCEPYSYYGGAIPPIPPLPPFPPMPPLGPLRGEGSGDDEIKDDEAEAAVKVAQAKKKQAKPKLKLTVARNDRPKRKESLPWIKW